MATKAIQSVRGMNDLLPGDVEVWNEVEVAVRRVVDLYGYREIRVPVLERTELFKRSIGEATDIVEKEMYTFLDNNGESVSLRPEATASCVRAGIEHGLFYNNRIRLWYMGPMFRYERPQRGRYRQFHQFGVEAFGWPGPDIDAEIILIGKTLWKLLGIEGSVKLEINTLGTPEARVTYRSDLVEWFERYENDLDIDSRRRLHVNPLRILDSKNPALQDLIEAAPTMMDYLGDDSRQHFDGLCGYLEDQGISYTVNPRLVRGLDYYTGTVFEWLTDLLGAQNAICAGGRYDGLVESLGGKAVTGAGFASGIERLVEILTQASTDIREYSTQVYVATMGDEAERTGFRLAEILRNAGIETTMHCGGGKLQRQLKSADQLNAQVGIIIGDDEVQSGTVTVKFLQTDQAQRSVAMSNVVQEICRALEKRELGSTQQ